MFLPARDAARHADAEMMSDESGRGFGDVILARWPDRRSRGFAARFGEPATLFCSLRGMGGGGGVVRALIAAKIHCRGGLESRRLRDGERSFRYIPRASPSGVSSRESLLGALHVLHPVSGGRTPRAVAHPGRTYAAVGGAKPLDTRDYARVA